MSPGAGPPLEPAPAGARAGLRGLWGLEERSGGGPWGGGASKGAGGWRAACDHPAHPRAHPAPETATRADIDDGLNLLLAELKAEDGAPAVRRRGGAGPGAAPQAQAHITTRGRAWPPPTPAAAGPRHAAWFHALPQDGPAGP